MPTPTSAAVRLRTAVDRFVTRVGSWGQPRWEQPVGSGEPGAPTRAQVVHDLVQRLADLCAGVEGRPALPVPRLVNDLALPDQLRVMVADLGLAGAADEVLHAAAADIEATAAQL